MVFDSRSIFLTELFVGNSALFDVANIVKFHNEFQKCSGIVIFATNKFHMLEIDHISKRPYMYIGTLGDGNHESHGIYNLLRIVLNSSICQFRAGIIDEIVIMIRDDSSVTICYPNTGVEYIEIIEALSSSYEIKTENGRMCMPFTSDETIFERFSFRNDIVFHLLKSYCYANKGLVIRYDGTVISAPNGLTDILNEDMKDDTLYPIIHLSGPGIEIPFTNRAKISETIYYSFVNGIMTEGGTHVNALKDALAKVIGNILYDMDICPSQILEGLSAAISIDIVDPVYGQANPHSLASS